MKEYTTYSEAETRALGEKLAGLLRPGDVVAYRGGLGAGKTAFTRGLAKGLGLPDEVSSPTFALVHEYRGTGPTLYHFDLYRITGFEDLESTGYFDYLEAGGILAVEWSENALEALPPETITIDIQRVDDTTRRITVEGDDRF
ncbi:tRNA (adenosine(37)-N6)-threonylcarbamoyltransferase complex ATPase subunit type 1 TsaE [Oscillospiraceae bacterium MB08-C2-2]|nr:tRNA (adenosine(37)-N6)-threonylcarbamoyltransferase complex ATPase subunit type 1 TsaE [Oscillospiraceae bacterium MB08-C2-2]